MAQIPSTVPALADSPFLFMTLRDPDDSWGSSFPLKCDNRCEGTVYMLSKYKVLCEKMQSGVSSPGLKLLANFLSSPLKQYNSPGDAEFQLFQPLKRVRPGVLRV